MWWLRFAENRGARYLCCASVGCSAAGTGVVIEASVRLDGDRWEKGLYSECVGR